MGFFEIIEFLVKFSLLMSIVQLYLRANKIWKRKNEREVADSQSIFGLSMLMINCIVWMISYIQKQDYESIIDTSIIMFEATIFLLIGTGFFVKDQKGRSWWTSIKQAMRLERKEANYLIKRFFRPANAETILNILHQLAMIDNEMDPEEEKLLASFAKEWNLEYSPDKYNKDRLTSTAKNYIRLRRSLHDYLDLDPPREQVAQLKDMMNAIVNADDKVSREEELISSELLGIISNYLEAGDKKPIHLVMIVPQKPEQELSIKELLPEARKVSISGGVAFSIGEYHSFKYADMICKEYRAIKFFTIVYSSSDEEIQYVDEAA